MAARGRFRFTAFWASVLVGLGFAFAVVGVVGAGLLLLLEAEIPVPPPWSRPLVAAVVLVGSLVVAAPLVLTGQLAQIFLDQRRLLGRIHRRLRRFEDEREAERTHPMRGRGRPS
jgi:uncharacterized SAM-binding protein YcdF (DUF218 family)